MKKNLIILIVMVMAISATSIWAQSTTENLYNFDDGTLMGFVKIYRYDDDPAAVTSSTDFPAAFPPPSGSYAVECADTDNSYYGLCSAVGGTIFDRTATTFTSATLEAKIYIVESTSTTEHNFALLAINQGGASSTEAYYRFGYRNGEIYLHKFNGGSFTTDMVTADTAIPASNMTIPGWNTFTIQFVGADTINCWVNGVATSFSPVTDTEASVDPEMQIGVLGFNMTSNDPIIVDDLYEKIELGSGVRDWEFY